MSDIMPSAKGEDIVVKLIGPATMTMEGQAVDAVTASRFAEAWFSDAQREAAPETAGDLHARRREIIFAVLCAESYLVEWVVELMMAAGHARSEVDEAYSQAADEAQRYFPKKKELATRWVMVPHDLEKDGVIGPLGEGPSKEVTKPFVELIGMRNDITHAFISQIEIISPNERKRHGLGTTPTNLVNLSPGWATNAIAMRILDLHRQTGTEAPAWVVTST